MMMLSTVFLHLHFVPPDFAHTGITEALHLGSVSRPYGEDLSRMALPL